MATYAKRPLVADRYRVIRRLGAGGTGTVFLAQDERLDREVALKRLLADSPEDAAQRFEREARLGASLNHPNLVAIYDTVNDDEGVVIVMEYVAGPTLADELAGGPLETARALEIVGRLGEALDHAHDAGVVHRDVKPANVLLGRGGRVKLADLGIATAAEHTNITRTGTVLGTPSYMAPEQLDGKPMGPAVDIYALAALAYEALTGEKARPGRTPLEIAHRAANQPPPDLRHVSGEAPAEAAELLMRGMARDPDERPSSAGRLARELSEALGSGGYGATQATTPMTRTAPARRAPVVAAPAVGAGASEGAHAERPAPTWTPYSRRSRGRWALPVALAALAVVLVAGVFLLSGNGSDGDRSGSSGGSERSTSSTGERSGTASTPAPAPAPTETQPATTPQPSAQGQDPERGRQLNDQGFALSNQGRNDEAVPILQQAVASFPEGSDDVNYAYALYNLGHALRLSGHPDEAIPHLQRRLEVSDYKRAIVQRELSLARAETKGG